MVKKKNSNLAKWVNPKSALITGASSGIGEAYAYYLALSGFKIILVARREEKLNLVAKTLEEKTGKKMEVLVADLTIDEDRLKVVNRIKNHNDIEILINNAGYGLRGGILKKEIDILTGMMQVHNTAPVEFSKAAVHKMIENRRGVIINISSLASLMRNPRSGLYSATKSFLNKFSESLAHELRNTQIKVQALCPGMTISEFHSVGDYKNYDRTKIPKFMWMSSEETVEISIKELRKKKTVIIPGKKNQFIIWLWNKTIIGKILMRVYSRMRQEDKLD